MKALLYQKKEKSFTFSVDSSIPSLQGTDVLIKVHFTSLNAADYRAMNMGSVPKNKIYGSAVSGVVERVGDACTLFKPGDEVIGELSDHGYGGLAEYAKAPEAVVVHKPKNVRFEDAVALPVAATTALAALCHKGKMELGKKQNKDVLIVGSSGGVGSFAVQIAKHLGAEVTAVCSTRNVDQSKELGATQIMDYTKTDFMKTAAKFDLILAINGSYSLMGYRKLLKPNGVHVTVGGSLGQIFKTMIFGPFLSIGSKKMKLLAAKSNSDDLKHTADLMSKGEIQAIIDKAFPWEKAIEAMEYVAAGHSSGKVIVSILS
jgi:NADPH:quinone reductase-like Zn-dependent oxidoreductase